MPFYEYSREKASQHENLFYPTLREKLKNYYEASHENIFLIRNYEKTGFKIDYLLIQDSAISILELKDYEGKISGGIDSTWYANAVPVTASGVNPFKQVKRQKEKLFSFFSLRKAFEPSELKHITAIVLFHGGLTETSTMKFDRNVLSWFQLANITNYVDVINAMTSDSINIDFRQPENILAMLELDVDWWKKENERRNGEANRIYGNKHDDENSNFKSNSVLEENKISRVPDNEVKVNFLLARCKEIEEELSLPMKHKKKDIMLFYKSLITEHYNTITQIEFLVKGDMGKSPESLTFQQILPNLHGERKPVGVIRKRLIAAILDAYNETEELLANQEGEKEEFRELITRNYNLWAMGNFFQKDTDGIPPKPKTYTELCPILYGKGRMDFLLKRSKIIGTELASLDKKQRLPKEHYKELLTEGFNNWREVQFIQIVKQNGEEVKPKTLTFDEIKKLRIKDRKTWSKLSRIEIEINLTIAEIQSLGIHKKITSNTTSEEIDTISKRNELRLLRAKVPRTDLEWLNDVRDDLGS